MCAKQGNFFSQNNLMRVRTYFVSTNVSFVALEYLRVTVHYVQLKMLCDKFDPALSNFQFELMTHGHYR